MSKNITKFNIKNKIINIWVKERNPFQKIYMEYIKNIDKHFIEKLKHIWKLDLPKEIKIKLCEDYEKISGQIALYEDEMNYVLTTTLIKLELEEEQEELERSLNLGRNLNIFEELLNSLETNEFSD